MTLTRAAGGAVFVGGDEFGSVVITAAGELDLAFAPTVLAAIRNALTKAPRRIVLDFASLTFLDSGGCDMLATAWSQARATGVRIALREEMAPTVRRVLGITMLLAVFDPDVPSLGG